jgi:hypothetical protein
MPCCDALLRGTRYVMELRPVPAGNTLLLVWYCPDVIHFDGKSALNSANRSWKNSDRDSATPPAL